MSDFLTELNYWLSQAYINIPIIITFITSFLLPTILRIHSTIKSQKAVIESSTNAIERVGATIDAINELSDIVVKLIESDISFNKELQEKLTIKKQKVVVGERVNQLEIMKTAVEQKKTMYRFNTPLTSAVKKVVKIKVNKNKQGVLEQVSKK